MKLIRKGLCYQKLDEKHENYRAIVHDKVFGKMESKAPVKR
jgi:hypothetical protein